MSLLAKYSNRLQENRITKTVLPFTLVGPERVRNLYRLVLPVENEKIRDIAECGVCKGGTGAVLPYVASRSRRNRLVGLLDSFPGMPEVTVNDSDSADGDKARNHGGKEVGDLRRVREVLNRVGADTLSAQALQPRHVLPFSGLETVDHTQTSTFSCFSSDQRAQFPALWYTFVALNTAVALCGSSGWYLI